MQQLNQQGLSWSLIWLDESSKALLSWITLWGFSLCSGESWITAVYDNVSYENKFNDNQFIDGQKIMSHLVKEKRISIDFVLKKETKDELAAYIQEFKSKVSWEIDFTAVIWWDIRVLRVVTENIRFNLDWITTTTQSWTLDIIATNPPRFYSYNPNTKYYLDISSDFTWQINNTGSSEAYPVYYIVFNDVTSPTSVLTLTINWYTVTLSNSFVSWDTLVISSDIYWIIQDADVYLNWSVIDYDGQITTPLHSWWNNIAFTCDGTYNCDITILFNRMRE